MLYVSPCSPTTPVKRVWALPISLATTFGISFDVFSLSYLDGSVHSVSLYLSILFKSVMIGSLLPGYPIRLSPDQRICAPPRSFSQLITAFFAGRLQDIHHKPILRLTILCSLLKTIIYSITVKNSSFHLIFHSPVHPFTLNKENSPSSILSFPSLAFQRSLRNTIFSDITISYSLSCKMGLIRVELMTPSLSEKCSNQLSYRPV